MRAVRYLSHGGPEVLQVHEVPIPVPAAGEALIEVEAVGANAIDAVFRRAAGPMSRPLPGTLSGDVVGRVTAVGPDTTGVAVGDRVAALTTDAFAEHVTAEARWTTPVPPDTDAVSATALAMIGPLAVRLLRAGNVGSGDTVLVHAAAGGVGHLAVQLARTFGAGTVIGTASTAEKRDFARERGADVVIDSSDPGWADQVRDATPAGVDVVLDAIGGAVFDQGMELLAPLGRMVGYGAIAGEFPTVSMRSLFTGQYVTGVSVLGWRAARPDLAAADAAEFADLLATGKVRSVVDSTHPLADTARVHEILDARANLGRLVVRP